MKFKVIKLFICFLSIILLIHQTNILLHPQVYLHQPNQIIYQDVKGEDINQKINHYDGKYVPLEEIAPSLIQTLLLIEDQNFFKHKGVNYKRLFKSIFVNLKNHSLSQGGSTITQQLARMIFLSNEKTIKRKYHELIIAKKIERKYTKNQILEMYLNNVYFAHNLYGINQASQYYFNVLPSNLDFHQSAILVAIINAPNIYAPDINLEACINKTNSILKTMKKNHLINESEYIDFAQKVPYFYCSNNNDNQYLSYYEDALEIQLNSLYLKNSKYENFSYQITSYLDKDLQKQIDQIIASYNFEENEDVAIVVMKPYSNNIISLIGGKSYNTSQFNRATQSHKQIGSTIKPIIYYLSLENEFSPLDEFISEPTIFNLGDQLFYQPTNVNDQYAKRKINMIEALSVSDNIYATKLSLFLGLDNIKNYLKRFDINLEEIDATIALGNLSLSLMDLVAIYNCFASEGTYYYPSFIKKIKNNYQDNLFVDQINKKDILRKNETLILNYLLSSPFDKTFNLYASPSLSSYQLNSRFCAKTGTTDSSSFVVGFNKNYTIGVYVGSDDSTSIKNKKYAKMIFQQIGNLLTTPQDEFYSIPTNCSSFKLKNPLTNKYSLQYIKKN